MLSGVIIFVLLVIALPAIPVSLSFHLSWQQQWQGTIRLNWLFGLVRIPIILPQPSSSPESVQDGYTKYTHRTASSGKRGTKRFSTVLLDKSLRRRIIRFIGDLWRAIRKKNLYLHLRIGLDDPADTGQLWGIIGPLSAMLACYRDAVIEFEPDFYGNTFELESRGDIRLVPLQIAYLLTGLLLSLSMRRTFIRKKQGTIQNGAAAPQ